MQAEPNYTKPRHRMLAEVAAGRIKVHVGLQWSVMRDDEFLPSNEQRAARVFRNVYIDRLPGRSGVASLAILTGGGRDLLTRWTARHGNPLLEQSSS